VILGDMLEMGDQSRQEHREIINLLLNKPFRLIILVGSEFKAVAKPSDPVMIFDDVQQASLWLKANPLQDYNILVKGSRGIRMEKVLDVL